MQWRPRPLLPNISGRLPCTIIRTCSGCCVPTPLTWSAVPCRARSKGSRAWSPNARSETEPSPSLIACKAWTSFSATTTSPKPSAASDRLRPPGCAPVRAHGIEGIPALNSRKDKTMTILMQASRQWASRPVDERYASLLDMQSTMTRRRERSRASVESTRALTVLPDESDPQHRGLYLGIECGPLAGQFLAPTPPAFGQVCSLAATPSPASYFRESRVPAPIIADALNYNLRYTREVRAATGPAYGRIWDADIVDALVERFGDGVSGHWRVPGEFGHRITVTKENTTLFASDRDMFVFLADEDRRIEVPDRRNGSGSMARGFFVWNSETGDKTLGLGFFLFDYVCANRIVWGADQYTEVRIRHTKGA